ncbi:glutathione S-transferase [Mycena crocata]|nr:glutathione S-transferase [Mycena crocata]
MVLKLYGGRAPRARAGYGLVALVLAEKQIPFELVLVDIVNKEHKTPKFLAMQPFGQVPVIDDDGFILYESRAICRYLAEKYADQGPRLLPTGLQEKALFEQAASVEFANFLPAVMKVGNEAIAKPRQDQPIDQTALAAAVAELSATLDVYDKILGKQAFLAGDKFTLVDLFHLMWAPLLAGADVDAMTSEKRPNVARWWNAVISRLAWVRLQEEGIKGSSG